MRATLRDIGVSERDFICECDASFKQGAKFQGWVTGAARDFYYHPFTAPQGFSECNLVPYWIAYGGTTSLSNMVCAQEHLCESHLAPKQSATAEYAGILNYAYHLNAGTFSAFVKRHCTNRLGVGRIIDKVVNVVSDERGDIQSVVLESGRSVGDDLVENERRSDNRGLDMGY